MKIVNKKTFYTYPAGTIFSEYKPQIFNEIFIKSDTLYNLDGEPCDYVEMSLVGNIDADSSNEHSKVLDEAEKGKSFDLDFDFFGRNGLYEDGQLYAVYEKKDLEGLISTLTECLKQAY